MRLKWRLRSFGNVRNNLPKISTYRKEKDSDTIFIWSVREVKQLIER